MYKTLIYLHKYKIILTLILICFSISSVSFSQSNINTSEESKLIFQPTFHSIQLDATIFILMYEAGGQFDFDFFTNDKNICLGTRMSIEHYNLGGFGGRMQGSPFTNYNIFARFSNRLGLLSISVLGGFTYYVTSDPKFLPDKFLSRVGFEIKLTDNIVGLLLKGSTSFVNKSGYIGVGVSLGYNHN